MWRGTQEEFVCAILTTVLASGITTVALAQTNVVPIGPEEIEIQVRQRWKDNEATCAKFNQAKIDRVDIINSNEFKNWLTTRHSIYRDGIDLYPKGSYARVASSEEDTGDGITVFGPVYATLKATDLRSIVGLPICNYKAQGPPRSR
ncbi:MAG: hypothetical protein ACJ8G3_21820 [Burkholderiaceae bacterium]